MLKSDTFSRGRGGFLFWDRISSVLKNSCSHPWIFCNTENSVVPIVASYRKLVAVAKNRRQSIETFHYRLSELCYGSKFSVKFGSFAVG